MFFVGIFEDKTAIKEEPQTETVFFVFAPLLLLCHPHRLGVVLRRTE